MFITAALPSYENSRLPQAAALVKLQTFGFPYQVSICALLCLIRNHTSVLVSTVEMGLQSLDDELLISIDAKQNCSISILSACIFHVTEPKVRLRRGI